MKAPPTFAITCSARLEDNHECGRRFTARTMFVAQQMFDGHEHRRVKRPEPQQLDLLGGDR